MSFDVKINHTFDRVSGWKPYKASMCTGCYSLCCRLPVEVKLADLIRLGYAEEGFDDGRQSVKKLAKQLQAQKIIQGYRVQTGLFTLAQKPTGDCLFLDHIARKCTVYEKRPGVCRKFPDVGPRPGYCPHIVAPK